jgi:hypothetical protein
MLKSSARYFREKPIENQAAFNTTLTVKDEDDFLDASVEKGFFDAGIGLAYILSGIREIALDL